MSWAFARTWLLALVLCLLVHLSVSSGDIARRAVLGEQKNSNKDNGQNKGKGTGESKRGDNEGQSKTWGKKSGQCVCVLDFDDTLKVYTDKGKNSVNSIAKDAWAVLDKCLDSKYAIAIASANDDGDRKVKPILKQIQPDIFSDDFIKSSACQIGVQNKTISLQRIQAHFKTDSRCMMLLDDGHWNRKFADALGVIFQQVDPRYGLRYKDFDDASWRMGQQCDCHQTSRFQDPRKPRSSSSQTNKKVHRSDG